MSLLNTQNFLTLADFSQEEIYFLLDIASQLKTAKKTGMEEKRLRGKNIALIFEKDSTRTRCAFEVAAHDQGAHVTYIGPTGSHIGIKESVKDTARVLGRLYHAIEYRGFSQQKVEEIARYAGIPVWNGLTDETHPTQILADFMTMQEHLSAKLNTLSLCYLGNGQNNVALSLLLGAAKMGMDFRLAAPRSYQPPQNKIEEACQIAQSTQAKIMVTEDVAIAVKNADFLYTDVWASMGEDKSVWQERIHLLQPYQVTLEVIKLTGNAEVKFMHCLPALHNRETQWGESIYQKYGLESLEVAEEVFESAYSIVFDQAENRLHTIKAIMVATLSGGEKK
jgi:ornithine carbamoyltransferase